MLNEIKTEMLSNSSSRSELDVLEAAAHYLRVFDAKRASEIIRNEYPFEKPEQSKRTYSMEEMIDLFIRDGFIDRYSGDKLIHPGILRILSELLGDGIFPYHPHWKTTDCHPAYWKYHPSVDHISPVCLGGKDDRSNWVTTSFSRNQLKGNTPLEQIGWELKPRGDFKDWDGLTHDFLALYEAYPKLHEVQRIKQWYQATVAVLEKRN